MSRIVRLLTVALLVLAGAAVAVPASAAPAPCALTWGSTPEVVPVQGQAPVVAARTGRHACWDRVVFEVRGPAAGYSVEYVPVVVQDGSGAPVVVPGGARLQVVLHHSAYDEQGGSTWSGPSPSVRGYATLRSVVYAGSFEGDTTVGVGTRARLPFRVFTLGGPGGDSRIVLDVAHSWT